MNEHASCFCDDPTEARERFLAECLKAGLAPLTLPVRADLAAASGPLYCDIVRLGAPAAHSAIVLCSGAGGPAGLVNAGICAGLLEGRIQKHLGRAVSIIMIHAVNPDGAPWPRPPAPTDTPVLVDGDAISKAEANWTRELLTAVDRRFGTELGHLPGGAPLPTEDEAPINEDMGGAWTREDLIRIADTYLSEAQFILGLDFRTGIGQWAVPGFRNTDPPSSASRGRAQRWFGPLDSEDTRPTDEQFTSSEAASGGLATLATEAESVSMIVEFGTFPGTGLVNSVNGRQQVRQDYPAQRDWREKVFAQAEAVILRAVEAAEEMANANRRLKSAELDEY